MNAESTFIFKFHPPTEFFRIQAIEMTRIYLSHICVPKKCRFFVRTYIFIGLIFGFSVLIPIVFNCYIHAASVLRQMFQDDPTFPNQFDLPKSTRRIDHIMCHLYFIYNISK